MAIFQRTLTAAVAAAALAGSFALTAHAQPAPAVQAAPAHAAAHHGPRAQQPVDLAQFHAARSERMKTLLQIQPKQQAAWEQYVQATTPQPRVERTAREDLRKLTTPERLERAQQLRKTRSAQVEQREQATLRFYQSLNTSQQKAFDELTVHAPGKHRGGRSHHMDHPRGPQHGSHHGPARGHGPANPPVSPAA